MHFEMLKSKLAILCNLYMLMFRQHFRREMRQGVYALEFALSAKAAEGKLIGPDGRLYAHSTSSCLIFDLPGAKTS